MFRPALIATCLALAVLPSVPASAQSLPSGGMTAGEIASWLRNAGFSAEVKPDPTTPGDQIVYTVTDGVNTDIYLYDCHGDGDARRCTSIQYAAGWEASSSYNLDKVNAWNRGNRYIKAYLTPRGSLYGEYDLDVSPGGTYDMLNDTMENWRRLLADFRKYYGV